MLNTGFSLKLIKQNQNQIKREGDCDSMASTPKDEGILKKGTSKKG